jgi:hypothetical protein
MHCIGVVGADADDAHGGAWPDADPEAAAWLLLSVLAARRMRAAAMPDSLESAVTALALRALAPTAADASERGQALPGRLGSPGTGPA